MAKALSDQEQVNGFLNEWKTSVVQKFGDRIEFILLFGSAARNEFVIGQSDVDLIIQTKTDSDVKPVNDFALKEFWRLDEKHQTGFRKVCSIGTGENELDSLIKKAEAQSRLYKPFEVFGPLDMDWKNGRIARPDLHFGAVWVASQLTLFYKLKTEGRVLFGKNILKEIKPLRTPWEKFKALIIPQHLAFGGVLLAFFLPKRAVKYATKSVLWELEGALIVRNQFVAGRKQQLEQLQYDLNSLPLISDFSWKKWANDLEIKVLNQHDLEWVKTCLAERKNPTVHGRIQAFLFCCNSLAWVVKIRFWTSLKEII